MIWGTERRLSQGRLTSARRRTGRRFTSFSGLEITHWRLRLTIKDTETSGKKSNMSLTSLKLGDFGYFGMIPCTI